MPTIEIKKLNAQFTMPIFYDTFPLGIIYNRSFIQYYIDVTRV